MLETIKQIKEKKLQSFEEVQQQVIVDENFLKAYEKIIDD